MKNNNTSLFKMNDAGEFVQDNINTYTSKKFKPDNPFFIGCIPYILMLICVVIDIGFFKSLFSIISYESPFLTWLEVAGLAFAADIVSAYAGILAKRISQGLSYEKFNLYLLLSVPSIALIINAILRCSTISIANGGITPEAVSLTIISIFVPIFTSIGNFSISYLTYDPLNQKLETEELALNEINEKCRRLNAINYDLKCDENCYERLVDLDNDHLKNAKKEIINDAFILLNDVQVQLMKCSKDPSESNLLSKSQCEELLAELRTELNSMNQLLNYSK